MKLDYETSIQITFPVRAVCPSNEEAAVRGLDLAAVLNGCDVGVHVPDVCFWGDYMTEAAGLIHTLLGGCAPMKSLGD